MNDFTLTVTVDKSKFFEFRTIHRLLFPRGKYALAKVYEKEVDVDMSPLTLKDCRLLKLIADGFFRKEGK